MQMMLSHLLETGGWTNRGALSAKFRIHVHSDGRFRHAHSLAHRMFDQAAADLLRVFDRLPSETFDRP